MSKPTHPTPGPLPDHRPDGTKPARQPLATLAEIRGQIDRLDATMHGLLIERSAVISDLIAIKKMQPHDDGEDPARRSSAFRPAREASMMRALVERHEGLLPLDTVESIWRVIISTFTYVQAPYEVAYAQGMDRLAMRDVARFHFGYTVPLRALDDAAGVLAAVGARGDALGVVPLASGGAWWQGLEGEGAPNVIARLPFVERADHPAGTPCLVVANAAIDTAATAARVVSVHLAGDALLNEWPARGVELLARTGERALLSVRDAAGLAWLAEDRAVTSLHEVGSHAPVFAP